MAALLSWLSRAGQTQPVLRSQGSTCSPTAWWVCTQPGGCAHTSPHFNCEETGADAVGLEQGSEDRRGRLTPPHSLQGRGRSQTPAPSSLHSLLTGSPPILPPVPPPVALTLYPDLLELRHLSDGLLQIFHKLLHLVRAQGTEMQHLLLLRARKWGHQGDTVRVVWKGDPRPAWP